MIMPLEPNSNCPYEIAQESQDKKPLREFISKLPRGFEEKLADGYLDKRKMYE